MQFFFFLFFFPQGDEEPFKLTCSSLPQATQQSSQLGKGTPSGRNAGKRTQEGTIDGWLHSSFSLSSNCLAADRGEKGERLGFHDFSHISCPRKWPTAGNHSQRKPESRSQGSSVNACVEAGKHSPKLFLGLLKLVIVGRLGEEGFRTLLRWLSEVGRNLCWSGDGAERRLFEQTLHPSCAGGLF